MNFLITHTLLKIQFQSELYDSWIARGDDRTERGIPLYNIGCPQRWSVGAESALEKETTTPLLSQEGWREAPGWFQSGILQAGAPGTTPRGIRFAIPLPS